jgi:hypothetical protein
MDPELLASHGEALLKIGRDLIDTINDIRARLAPHDPSSGAGDDTGKAIQAQYFANARDLLDVSHQYGDILVDMGDLTVSSAEHGAYTEQRLTKLNEDLGGDPKPGPSTWEDNPNPAPTSTTIA